MENGTSKSRTARDVQEERDFKRRWLCSPSSSIPFGAAPACSSCVRDSFLDENRRNLDPFVAAPPGRVPAVDSFPDVRQSAGNSPVAGGKFVAAK